MTSLSSPARDRASRPIDSDQLRAVFAGEVLTHVDGAAYDDARAVFNAMFDRRPALIARATSTADVAAVLRFARASDLPIAVRGGGHSVAGYSTIDDGIVIDLGPMNRIEVDAATRRARVGAGARWGEVDRATQEFGLATTGGRMTTTGVAGFTLGSGSGWLERLHGLACDNLISAEVVCADGTVLTVSETEHPDLFWGLRGGGGNFGIVTEFEFRLHPVGPVLLGGLLLHPRDRAPEVCRFFRDFMAEAPREVAAGLIFMHAPPAPFVPVDLQGRPAVAIIAGYVGPLDEGAEVLAPLRAFAGPAVDVIGPMPYVDFQAITDAGNPPGRRNYWRSEVLREMTDDAIDTLVACAAMATSPASVVVMGPVGGAVADVADDATPIGGRSAPWLYHCYGIWTDGDDDRHISWVRSTEAAMRPWAAAGIALNFVSDIDDARVRTTFGHDKYLRLEALKASYDPDNVFRQNQNIPPRAGGVPA
jgi:FAD/FMN-containing dehydrogenase